MVNNTVPCNKAKPIGEITENASQVRFVPNIPQSGVTVDADVYILALDLTLLFPTDPDFVTSLTQSDAIKVAHRLGFAAFTLD